MSTLPAPILPPEIDLTDFDFMPLGVRQLRDSRFAAATEPEEFRAGLLLWCASWHQVPAGSLPNDDFELANFAGYGRVIKEWKKYKVGAMQGFILCSDGLWYHPIICEKALESWRKKQEYRHEKEADRRRKHNQKHPEKLPIPTLSEWYQEVFGRPCPWESVIDSAGKIGKSAGKENCSAGNPPENALKYKCTDTVNIKPIHTQGDAAPDDSLIGSVRQWQPTNKILFAKLHIAGVPPPDPSQLPRLLDEFHSHYASKALTDSQCYTKFVNWIRNDRHGKQPTQHTGTHASSRQPARRLTAAEQIEHDCRAELDRIRRAEGD